MTDKCTMYTTDVQLLASYLLMLTKSIFLRSYSIYMHIREVKDCLAFQESSMAINMLVMRVNQAQKVKETVNNLLLSIAPRGHRVRRGNTKEKMQICKF